VKLDLSVEYWKYLWDEAIWGVLQGRTLLVGDEYELEAQKVGKYFIRSRIDTLQGPVRLSLLRMTHDETDKTIIELSVEYETGAISNPMMRGIESWLSH
jgi:hypothetical protein